MRVGFAGTPDFAAAALGALLGAGYTVPLVWTQPDRPAGRGQRLQASAVKQLALQHGLPLLQPCSLRLDGRFPADAAAAQAALQAAALDMLVVAAYGLILPPWTLAVPRHGCLNIHASLLPRWRGAAPIQRAIEAGDAQTGITLMQMDEGLDTGAMLLSEATAIEAGDSSASLHERLAAIGARLLLQGLAQRSAGTLSSTPQPADGASYAPKIEKTEAAIDWHQPAAVIERRLRAFDPFPGCNAVLRGETVKVWRARVVAAQGEPGVVLAAGGGTLRIACGTDALDLLQLQRPGGRRLDVEAFLRAQVAVQPGR
ncbi:MAG: methionyl-tRNA formyltransferase [Pseudomonadota bacterium]|nr:methionyl-tRNA formyltransferase [Pseudomonadota bacterium]